MGGRSRLSAVVLLLTLVGVTSLTLGRKAGAQPQQSDPIADNARRMLTEGKNIFRFDSFGDEAFWGDTLRLVCSHLPNRGTVTGTVRTTFER